MRRDRYVRGDVLKLGMAIRKGWNPSDQIVSETFADLVDVLADPLASPRATVRAAELIFHLHVGGYPGTADCWRNLPKDLIESAQRGLQAVAVESHRNDRARLWAYRLYQSIDQLVND